MKKEFTFSAKLDTAGFDQAIQQLQQKLKAAMAPSSMAQMQQQTSNRLAQAGVGGMSAPSMEAFQKATQASRRELDALITSQAQGQEKLGKIIAQRSEMLKKLQEQQKQMNKGSEEELKLKEKIARVEANSQQLRESYRQRDAALNQAMDAKENLSSGTRNSIGRGGALLGAAGKAIGYAGQAYEHFGGTPFRSALNFGSAIQGTMGQSIQDMKNPYGQAWMSERVRAADMARRQMEVNRTGDKFRLASGTAMFGGGATLAATGAAESATGVGAIAGIPSMFAGGASMLGGAGTLLGNANMRSLTASHALSGMGNAVGNNGIGDWLKSKGQGQMDEYNSGIAKDFAENFQSALKATQQSNPLKDLAAQTYSENYMRDLGAQRSMGLDFDTYHGTGGYRARAEKSGFTDELALGMSSEILGAGGSTRMAQDPREALKYQRGYNLTNAGQLMGKISGSTGSAETTDQAMIKILSEGMKHGLDDSKFAEENRKFSQSVAEIISRSGARTEAGFESNAGGFGRFLNENTSAGIAGAKTAYEQYQGNSASTAGPRGAMQYAAFMKDPKLAQLSVMEKQSLAGLPSEQLTESNPMVTAAALAHGMEPGELIESLNKAKGSTQSRFSTVDAAAARLRGKVDTKQLSDVKYMRTLSKEQQADVSTVFGGSAADQGHLDPFGEQARAAGLIRGEGVAEDPDVVAARKKAIQEHKEMGTGKQEDQTVAGLAENQRLALGAFQAFHKELTPSVETIRAFNEGLIKLNKQLQQMNAGGDRDNLGNILSQSMGVRSPTQQTGGRSSGTP